MEIRKREKLLLDRLDLIRGRKVAVLESQCADLKVAQTSMKTITEQLTLCSNNGHEVKLINATNDAMKSLKGRCSIFISLCTGKSLSEHGENMMCTKIVLNVGNNFCTQHFLPRFELGIFV